MTSQVQRRQQTIKSRYISRATIYTTVSCFWEWLCICFVLVFELSINILLFKALQLCGNYLHNFLIFRLLKTSIKAIYMGFCVSALSLKLHVVLSLITLVTRTDLRKEIVLNSLVKHNN